MNLLALKFWHLLYRLMLCFAYPWARIRPLLRARREPEYAQRLGERFGKVPAGIPQHAIWFHTVSAGEAIAAAGLIESLAREFPELDFLVTTTTPTGSAQVRHLLSDRQANISHCYAPFDFVHAVRASFAALRPRLLVLMETELWPNLIAQARQDSVPVLLINARLSAKSAAGYQRVAPLAREMLSSLHFLACQTRAHAERFLALGAAADRMAVYGSLKFDAVLPADHQARVAQLRADWQLQQRFVWLAGSTHAGEEGVVLEAHRQLLAAAPAALLILAPRHPARTDAVVALLREGRFNFVRRSQGTVVGAGTQVLLLDTLGELTFFYGLSDVAFVGGSLVGVGGHNPIEAAICAQPLLMGPATFNFPDVVAAFSDAGCLTMVTDAAGIAAELCAYRDDATRRAAQGAIARQVVLDNRGALARLQSLLRKEIRAVSSRLSVPPAK